MLKNIFNKNIHQKEDLQKNCIIVMDNVLASMHCPII
jgi:hypothetical protein